MQDTLEFYIAHSLKVLKRVYNQNVDDGKVIKIHGGLAVKQRETS